MLLGQYSSKLSSGKRVAIPKKFRSNLGSTFIIAKWYENCLVIVSQKNWEGLLAKLTGNTMIITQPVRDTDRFILGSAYEVTPDSQGRVVLPEALSKYASLKNEVAFLGLGNRAEIWNKGLWERREEYLGKTASSRIEKLGKNENS